MFLKPSAAFTFQGFTNDSTGTLATPGTPPTAVLTRNGTDDVAVTCTVTSISVGRYKVGGSIPSGYVAGDVCQVVFNATVGGISGSNVIGEFVVDTAYVSDVPTNLLDLANGVETGITLRQAMRLFTAILAGKATDSAGTYTLKRQDGTTTAVTIIHDAVGNRSAITIGSL